MTAHIVKFFFPRTLGRLDAKWAFPRLQEGLAALSVFTVEPDTTSLTGLACEECGLRAGVRSPSGA